jgi:LmbE family N-acetylglucosaminyl deacetylase
MLGLELPPAPEGLRLLCLGAHAADIEIGCGGTVLKLARQGALRSVTWVVLSAEGEGAAEARASAACVLADVEERRVHVASFRDGHFPRELEALEERIQAVAAEGDVDLVLTHARHDRHQDHRVVSDLTWSTWRDHLVLEYEIPKVDGDLGRPNLYVPLDDDMRRRKVELLLAGFPSQRERPGFDPDTFNGLMRLRGLEARSRSRWAEAFFAHAVVLD